MRNQEFNARQNIHETAWMLSVAAMGLVLSLASAFGSIL